MSATNVIALPARADRDAAGPLDRIAAHWGAARDGRLIPDRGDVDPRALAAALPHTCLIERIAPGIARFRLAGQHLADLMGMDLRGMPVSAFFTAAARDDLADALQAVFDEPARVDLTLQSPRAGLFGPHGAQMLLLPLRGRDGTVNLALGGMIATGAASRVPVRFAIHSQDRRTLTGYADRPAPQDAPFAPADAARDMVRDRARIRARLRLV